MPETEDERYRGPNRQVGPETGGYQANLLLIDLGRRVGKVEEKLETQEIAMAENTAMTARNAATLEQLEKNLAGAVKFFKAVDGTITIGAMAGKLAKWLTIVGAAVAVLWFLIKYIVVEIVKGMQ